MLLRPFPLGSATCWLWPVGREQVFGEQTLVICFVLLGVPLCTSACTVTAGPG